MDMSIEGRQARARTALEAYRNDSEDYNDRPEEPDLQAITDLIADLMHLAKDLGEEDPERILTMATIHYNEEQEEAE